MTSSVSGTVSTNGGVKVRSLIVQAGVALAYRGSQDTGYGGGGISGGFSQGEVLVMHEVHEGQKPPTVAAFAHDVGDRVVNAFGVEGIVCTCAVGRAGKSYYVDLATGTGAWIYEDELSAART